MTKKSKGDKSSPDNEQNAKVDAAEKQRVARTRLDINMDDLIEPLTGDTSAKNDRKVSKTLLETDGPTLDRIKELAEAEVENLSSEDFKALRKELSQTLPESPVLKNKPEIKQSSTNLDLDGRGKNSSAIQNQKVEDSNSADISSPNKHLSKTILEPGMSIVETDALKKPEATDDTAPLIKELAKTIPEPATRKGNLQTDAPVFEETDEDAMSLKELATTLPDPPMQERKAVARRIERIRSAQKTTQPKKFSKTVSSTNLENLDSIAESVEWKSPSKSPTEAPSKAPSKAPSEAPFKAPSEAPLPKEQTPVREQFVARTRLDHNILFQAVSDSKVKEEARVAALIVEKSKEAPKPPPVLVKADKPSSPCPFKWEETDSKDKYRYCTNCQTAIYNFDGMERPEAEALIFNRENRDKFTLYSRTDGKFMTVNCPVQKKRQRDLIMGAIAAVAILIGVICLVTLMPQQQPQPVSSTSPTSASSGSSGGSDSTLNRVNTPESSGIITFSSNSKQKPSFGKKTASGASSANGAGVQTFKLPDANSQSAQAHDPDEDGSFWKY